MIQFSINGESCGSCKMESSMAMIRHHRPRPNDKHIMGTNTAVWGSPKPGRPDILVPVCQSMGNLQTLDNASYEAVDNDMDACS